MPDIFGIDLRAEIGTAFAGLLPSAALIKITQGARNPSEPSAGRTITETSYPCEGSMDSVSAYKQAVLKVACEKEFTMTAYSCAAIPSVGDLLLYSGIRHKIISVETDPAEAAYILSLAA